MTSPGSRVWESRLPGSERVRGQLWPRQNIVAPPGNQAANRENKPCPVAKGALGLLANGQTISGWLLPVSDYPVFRFSPTVCLRDRLLVGDHKKLAFMIYTTDAPTRAERQASPKTR